MIKLVDSALMDLSYVVVALKTNLKLSSIFLIKVTWTKKFGDIFQILVVFCSYRITSDTTLCNGVFWIQKLVPTVF